MRGCSTTQRGRTSPCRNLAVRQRLPRPPRHVSLAFVPSLSGQLVVSHSTSTEYSEIGAVSFPQVQRRLTSGTRRWLLTRETNATTHLLRCHSTYKMPSFYQDRLGTDIGKALKKSDMRFFAGARVPTPLLLSATRPVRVYPPRGYLYTPTKSI